jgi:precorrin-2 dehydrogenase / sirohydrochlorin ferrochelatase
MEKDSGFHCESRIFILGGLNLSSFCPLNINLQGRECLVIGGGVVALRKAKLMLGYGAVVTVVSPHLVKELQELTGEGQVAYLADIYRPAYLQQKFIVICATDDPQVNRSAAAACRERGILVNSVSEPENCTIFFPAQFREGALSIAVSTDGSSPALARRLKNELQEQLDPAYADFTLFLKKIRPTIISEIKDSAKRRAVLESLAGERFFNVFKKTDPADLNSLAELIISGEAELDIE